MSDGGNGVALEFDGEAVTHTEKPIRRFYDLPDVMTMNIPPIEYLVDGMIARKTITLWTGSDGTAKTYLAQKMSIAVASGSKFLGRRCHAAPVLFLDYENPAFAVRERLDVMAGAPIADLKVWGTWLEQQPPQIDNELLLTIAKETQPLIIIDPFRYAHGAEENDSTEMMRVMQILRYCAASGGAVVILHHPAKTEGSTGRGSSAIKGAADVAFLQEMSDESGLITLKCTKNRFGSRICVTIRPNFEEGTFEVCDSPEFVKLEAETDRLLEIITATPGLNQNAWWKQSGMMKQRFVTLVKNNIGILWTEEKRGAALCYFPTCSQTQNSPENSRTGQGESSCSPVLTALSENRRTACSRPDDLFSNEVVNREQVARKSAVGSAHTAARIVEVKL
ncbi:MAG TPA: AAA family ATPase [Candidatus Sulfotelmatobacter sp.]|nr:AAA family ATPase [Candidatus Sulfotelmatobacter sp.]